MYSIAGSVRISVRGMKPVATSAEVWAPPSQISIANDAAIATINATTSAST